MGYSDVINMPDPASQITKNFTWHEALYLPSWERLATEADGLNQSVLTNLVLTFQKLQSVRDWAQQYAVGLPYELPINVHCAYRPHAYNTAVGGAAGSAHMFGQAADFDIGGEKLVPQFVERIIEANLLDKLNLRMEKGTDTWIHLDTRAPGPSGRYFTP